MHESIGAIELNQTQSSRFSLDEVVVVDKRRDNFGLQ